MLGEDVPFLQNFKRKSLLLFSTCVTQEMAGGVSLRWCPIQTSQGDRGALREETTGSSGAGACPFKCAGRALCAFRGPSPGWWARGREVQRA